MVRMTISGFKRSGDFAEKRLPQMKRPSEGNSREIALVLDEENPRRANIHRILNTLGVDAVGVATPEAAFDHLYMRSSHFDFVLVDFNITTISGPETVRRIRLLGVTTKILGVCNDSEEDTEAFLEAGVDALVRKPLNAENLGNALREMRESD